MYISKRKNGFYFIEYLDPATNKIRRQTTKSKKGSINDKAWMEIWSTSPVKSIEHIFPQKPEEYWKDWRGKLGKGPNVVHKHKHRLGNLSLVTPTLNSACQNYSFSKKKKIYKNLPLRLLNEIANKRDWNLKTINQREKRLIKWAKAFWGD